MERGSRAQTSVDFAIGMGVFLVALTTVIAFMPTMTQPFTGGQQNPLVADRLAAQLVDSQLGDPVSPSTLDTACTMFFFNESSSPDDPCPSFEPGWELTRKLGVEDTTFVNVTVRKDLTGGADPETICASNGADAAETLSAPSSGCPSGEIRMVDGPAPPTAAGSIILARRLGLLEGERVYVVVRVWV